MKTHKVKFASFLPTRGFGTRADSYGNCNWLFKFKENLSS